MYEIRPEISLNTKYNPTDKSNVLLAIRSQQKQNKHTFLHKFTASQLFTADICKLQHTQTVCDTVLTYLYIGTISLNLVLVPTPQFALVHCFHPSLSTDQLCSQLKIHSNRMGAKKKESSGHILFYHAPSLGMVFLKKKYENLTKK